MGRNYQDELRELDATTARVDVPHVHLEQAIKVCSDRSLIIVASGGAQIVARWLSRLHLATFGQSATVVTPLEAVILNPPPGAAVWLISQGGGHPDILKAARWACRRDGLSTFAIVGRNDSALSRVISEAGGIAGSLGTAADADGFLSTNGLWAMLCAITRSYATVSSRPEANLRQPMFLDVLDWARGAADRIVNTGSRDTVVIVADPWTLIGAEDLKVRATEASLALVWTTDFRNLGHGRHFWLADRASTTGCIFLPSISSVPLSAWTRSGLPEQLAFDELPIPFDGQLAGLAAVAWSIHWTARLASRLARDPGRPGVPAFGERLYEGDVPFGEAISHASATEQPAIAMKSRAAIEELSDVASSQWRRAWTAFSRSLTAQTFRAVVFDFDGTLVHSHHRWDPISDDVTALLRRLLTHGVYIGIATGRGDSVQRVLQQALRGCDTSRVFVGYHNGASVRALDAPAKDLDDPCTDARLLAASELLQARLQSFAECSRRRHQVTLKPRAGTNLKNLWLSARAVLNEGDETRALNVWLSSHSIDVCEPQATKNNVVAELGKLMECSDAEILRVGDRGAWPGNDFELLDHANGLSVDECSFDPNHCWNIGAPDQKGPSGVAAILRRVRLEPGPGMFFIDMECEK